MTPPRLSLSLADTRDKLLSLRGVLFDLDGVLTPTVDVHMRAWDLLFNAFLAEKGVTEPYTDSDYFEYVDGKPRYDGVRSLLASRGLTLPDGDPSDAPEEETICGLGNRKNAAFNETLAADGVSPYPGSIPFLDMVVAAGLDVAVVTSSRNGEMVLAAAGLRDRFEVVVDGVVAAREQLAGKPAPTTYEYAATLLGYTAAECVVIEDAQSGVKAGRAGNFGLVLGVDRGVGADVLMADGADAVVADLIELVHTTAGTTAGATE
ncbi:HAD superfamily hydrolase (TIGR01509 family)/beta-phosphoglucomutase family hydrolase [Glaciihabitans tibetensis]|uniref:Beta-phosphoglucomutase n=1 Tax=Glaciihabitans tibetensis TaxID=1266600 RepID=A0A2T0VEB5_9MICO|nr:beta-phosphoglucomutase family hydrolase [Glaciihabitans tibetensis]PRY68472.1 HAD superfamily hydrolase (TIGR01509 family)/beta-phosphoglucomutase family hydrolase [Glaciihabitans tibetensis]